MADGRRAFITSANLIGHAMEKNLEIGALVTGGDVPRRPAEHFQALMERGVLKRG